MDEDKRWALTEDIIEGLAHGEVLTSTDAFSIERVDAGTVLKVDLGDPGQVYIVTVTSVARAG
jgi:hypothetical protein